MWGKFIGHDFFAYDEIENVQIGWGLIQRPMKFKFKNGRIMKIKAALKGVERVASTSVTDEKAKDQTSPYPIAAGR